MLTSSLSRTVVFVTFRFCVSAIILIACFCIIPLLSINELPFFFINDWKSIVYFLTLYSWIYFVEVRVSKVYTKEDNNKKDEAAFLIGFTSLCACIAGFFYLLLLKHIPELSPKDESWWMFLSSIGILEAFWIIILVKIRLPEHGE